MTKENWKHTLKVVGFLAASAALTAMSDVLLQVDFGVWTPVVMAVWNVLLVAGKEFLKADG